MSTVTSYSMKESYIISYSMKEWKMKKKHKKQKKSQTYQQNLFLTIIVVFLIQNTDNDSYETFGDIRDTICKVTCW